MRAIDDTTITSKCRFDSSILTIQLLSIEIFLRRVYDTILLLSFENVEDSIIFLVFVY